MLSRSEEGLPFISVVIPSYFGSGTILYVLTNLLNQNYPKTRYEVVVVDDGSRDSTIDLVSELIDDFSAKGWKIVLLKNDRKGAAAARNLAVKRCNGEIVAMVDQDVFIPSNWLSEIADFFRDSKVAGLYGKIITDFANFIEPLNSTAINRRYLTANLAYRKDVLLEVGVFSEEFPFYRGDSDLAYKIIERGYSIAYAPNVVVYHPLRKFSLKSLKRALEWSVYDPLLYRKFPELSKKDTFSPMVARFTPEGIAFILFISIVSITAFFFSPIFGFEMALLLLGLSVISLAFVRRSLRGKSWAVRLEAASVTLIEYLPTVIGRIIGSVKYHKLII